MRQKLWADEVIEAIVNGEEISVGVQVTKIQVPPAMLEAAREAQRQLRDDSMLEEVIEAALRWLSENPIVPTADQKEYMFTWMQKTGGGNDWDCLVQWQRRMFLAPEPEVPEEIADMQLIHLGSIQSQEELDRLVRDTQLEAFKLGKQSN